MNNINIFACIAAFCIGFAIDFFINEFSKRKTHSGNIIIDEDKESNKMKYLFEFGIDPEELSRRKMASFNIVHKKLTVNERNDIDS